MGLTGTTGPKGDTGPAGAGGLRVVDDTGKDVGTFVPGFSPAVILEVEGTWVQIGLTGKAFAPCSSASTACPWYVFEDASCAGPVYIAAGNGLVQDAVLVGNTIRYPAGPVTMLMVNSIRVDDAGTCYPMSGTQPSAKMNSVPLSSLGVAPFHLAH